MNGMESENVYGGEMDRVMAKMTGPVAKHKTNK